MKRWLLWIIIIVSLIGIVGSLLATHQYFQIIQFGFEKASFCNINEFINCDAAYASSHAKIFGVPASWMGFVFYLYSAILALWILFKEKAVQEVASLGWLLALGSVLLSIQKATVSFFILKVLCLICLAMYFVNIALFILWFAFVKKPSFKAHWQALTISTLVVFGLGFALIASYQDRFIKETKLPIATKELVAFHFRQGEYQFDIDPEAPVWGNPQAKVTLVEFSDFQCPFCRHAAFHIKPVLAEFKEKIRFYFYNYPLDPACNETVTMGGHDKACLAAQAALCASNKGDFWSYHDDLFRHQRKLGRDLFLELAKKRGWSESEFEACIDAPETLARLKKYIEAATKIHIDGTPTLLLNNRRMKYWTNPEVLRAILKEEIKRRY